MKNPTEVLLLDIFLRFLAFLEGTTLTMPMDRILVSVNSNIHPPRPLMVHFVAQRSDKKSIKMVADTTGATLDTCNQKKGELPFTRLRKKSKIKTLNTLVKYEFIKIMSM